MATTADTVSIGSIVEYEDAANPPRRYVVVSEIDQWANGFTLRNLDAAAGYAYHQSDLRQAGWTLISA